MNAHWPSVPLGELVSEENPICYGILMPGEHITDGIPVIKVRNFEGGVLRISSLQRTSHEIESRYKRSRIQPEDILLSIRGTVGEVVIVPPELSVSNITQDTARIRTNGQIDRRFLVHALRSEVVQSQIRHQTIGQAVKGINIRCVRKLEIPFPSRPEQVSIARVLDVWDRGTRKLSDMISLKLHFKRGLMQQLLTGKRRFRGYKTRDVRYCVLQEFLTLTARPIRRPSTAYTALGLRSHGKGTFFRTIDDPEQVQMDTLYQVKKDDLIVNITFAWEGAVAIVSEEDEQALVSHRFPTFIFDHAKALPQYLRQVVMTPWFIFKMGLVSPGGAGRNRVLNKKDFLRIAIPLPELDEQEQIADVLKEVDHEISLLKQQIEALKQQKKGLMQRLLTGQVRVKP